MPSTTRSAPAKTVEAYFEALPPKQRATLTKFRKTIRSLIPKAEEVISYQIPTFKINGTGIIAIAAFAKHYSLFPMSSALLKEFAEELDDFEISTGTIRIPYDKSIPTSLVKKIVEGRLKEISKKAAEKKNGKTPAPVKVKGAKPTDAEKVEMHMRKLKHPLKPEMEAVRSIIRNANSKIEERIKWNAPSYYYKEDLVTFNAWAQQQVHLVFHHPVIVRIKSAILEGDYPTRRMTYFQDMAEVKAKKKELERIINELVKFMDSK